MFELAFYDTRLQEQLNGGDEFYTRDPADLEGLLLRRHSQKIGNEVM